jgi:hypothetical protein
MRGGSASTTRRHSAGGTGQNVSVARTNGQRANFSTASVISHGPVSPQYSVSLSASRQTRDAYSIAALPAGMRIALHVASTRPVTIVSLEITHSLSKRSGRRQTMSVSNHQPPRRKSSS